MADTGMNDKDYNLVSVMYHALQGAEETQTYINDARQSGDEEAANFLQDVQDNYRKIAEKAKPLLKNRM